MSESDMLIQGRQVYLRDLRESDVGPAYLGWMRDPLVTRGLESRFVEHTPDSLLQYVRAMRARPDTIFLAIVLLDGHCHVGNVKIGPLDPHHGTADLGILIGDKACWGRGVGSEAIALATRHAFAAAGLRKLTAGVYSDNPGSVRAFRKAGWVEEGRLKDQYLSAGVAVDKIQMAIFNPRWKSRD